MHVQCPAKVLVDRLAVIIWLEGQHGTHDNKETVFEVLSQLYVVPVGCVGVGYDIAVGIKLVIETSPATKSKAMQSRFQN